MALLKKQTNVNGNLILIGVTGTFGKTLVTHLLFHILGKSGKKVGFISTNGYSIDGEKELNDLNASNISKKDLDSLLSDMKKCGVEIAVVEMTTKNIEKGLYKDLSLDTGIITNIAGDFENYKTWDKYAQIKLEFIKLIKNEGLLIINGDESDTVEWLKANSKKFHNNIYVYWTSNSNIQNETTTLNGFSMDINGFIKVFTPLVGFFNKMNVYQAARAASKYVYPNMIQQSLPEFKVPKGRFEQIYTNPYTVFVDYSQNPDTVNQALSYLKIHKAPQSRIISIVGTSGLKDQSFRKIGDTATKFSDLVLITSNDPYHIPVYQINNDIVSYAEAAGAALIERFNSTEEYELIDKKNLLSKLNMVSDNGRIPAISFDNDDFTGRLDAIRLGFKAARPGDIIYITGKGHETSTRYGDVEYEWSDFEAAKIGLSEALGN